MKRRTRQRLILVALGALGGLLLPWSPADAHMKPVHRDRVKLTINQACDSTWNNERWTTIAFGMYRNGQPVMDDGTALLQVFDRSGRSNGGGILTFEMFGEDHAPDDDDLLVSGGEGHLRFNEGKFASQGGHPKAYRVLFNGAASQWVHADKELNCNV